MIFNFCYNLPMFISSFRKYIPKKIKSFLVRFYVSLRKRALFVRRRFVSPPMPVNKDGKVYLNLGCANTSGPEFVNIDIEPYPNIHYVQDITDLSNFRDESVDMVYASHVLEHIPRHQFTATLKEWKRVLKKGGIFRFAVPNFDALIDIYTQTGKNVEIVRDQVLGQDPPYHNHHTLWNFHYAQKILTDCGFSNVRLWDVNKVDHHAFVDRASRSMRVGNEDVLFSLNVEAEKV